MSFSDPGSVDGLESEEFAAKSVMFVPEGVVVCAALQRAGNSTELKYLHRDHEVQPAVVFEKAKP